LVLYLDLICDEDGSSGGEKDFYIASKGLRRDYCP
jgi:hypothetical protein